MFVAQALRVHGDRYGYDRCCYIDAHIPVEIYCPRHKEYFWQRPRVHLVRGGCPKCTCLENCV